MNWHNSLLTTQNEQTLVYMPMQATSNIITANTLSIFTLFSLDDLTLKMGALLFQNNGNKSTYTVQ
jgi:hypothetical protein